MKTFSITDVGMRREMNQDYVYTSEQSVGNLPNLFIVADGMGGHNAGDYASKYTVDTIVEEIEKSDFTEPLAVIEHAIKTANNRLLAKAEADVTMRGMGTTIVLLTIYGEHLYIANVGDSRLYVVGSEIRQITKDHSLVQEMVRLGELDKETAKDHPQKNVITRAIGAIPDVEIDYFELEISDRDNILMCSDGLTNMIDDEDIKNIILGQRDIAEKAEKLVETANKNGGKDNITVVVIEPFSDEVKKC